MKLRKKIYFFPRTKIGKISFWLVISGFIIVYALYWSSMLMQANNNCDENGICYSSPGGLRLVSIVLSLLAMGSICIAGILSIISIVKYRDYAILLFISALIGIIGILFLLGEVLVPH